MNCIFFINKNQNKACMKAKLKLRLLLLVSVLTALTVHAQEKKVSGKVTDENSNPLNGASVIVKGTTNGTNTDEAGSFTITLPNENSILVISFAGYSLQEVKVAKLASITVKLLPDAKKQALNEVVVVGYGTQRKVDVTGAVGSVTRKDFANKPFTSPDQILGGRVAGVHIANRSGDPAAPIEVRIRGVGTAGNSQPLWVIDGVPVALTSNITVNTSSTTESNPLAGINPSDIESIDVLKDASATAIYGARASNGVIMVTTKRGKEGRTTLSYEGYVGSQSVQKSAKFDVLNVAEYIALQKEVNPTINLSAFAGKPEVNWQDEVFRKAMASSHNLSISGGSKNSNYSIGGGYLQQEIL
jgi:TonB-dependent starch-binding outer membrane protein SusC